MRMSLYGREIKLTILFILHQTADVRCSLPVDLASEEKGKTRQRGESVNMVIKDVGTWVFHPLRAEIFWIKSESPCLYVVNSLIKRQHFISARYCNVSVYS